MHVWCVVLQVYHLCLELRLAAHGLVHHPGLAVHFLLDEEGSLKVLADGAPPRPECLSGVGQLSRLPGTTCDRVVTPLPPSVVFEIGSRKVRGVVLSKQNFYACKLLSVSWWHRQPDVYVLVVDVVAGSIECFAERLADLYRRQVFKGEGNPLTIPFSGSFLQDL